MTKELSKQLCELCGVEPHHYETELQIENNKVVETIKKVKYPDFGKSSNFVKLLQIYYFLAECNLEDMFFDWENLGNGLIEDVLANIIEDLETHEYDQTWESKLIYEIKNTEWEY